MKKQYLMNGMALAAMVLTVGCTRMEGYQPDPNANEKEFEQNFSTLVLNGNSVDPSQTWNTAVGTNVTVSVDLNYGEKYTVYIFESDPVTNSNAAYIGKAEVMSGQTTTLKIARPATCAVVYAACYDKNSHAIVNSFPVLSNATTVSFSNKVSANAPAKAITRTGEANRWDVATQNFPDLTAYTTGTTAITNENNNTIGKIPTNPNPVYKYVIPEGTTWTGIVHKLSADGAEEAPSLYVEGKWVIPASLPNQGVNYYSTVVVGPKGEIEIEEGATLFTNDKGDGNSGMIHVMPGGKITGNGTLLYANGTEVYSHNAGTIDVKQININGGVLYNTGTIGKATGNQTSIVSGASKDATDYGKLINHGTAYLVNATGAGFGFENGCNMYISGQLQIGKTSKMGSNSYIETKDLYLAGGNGSTTEILYMGEASYIKVSGNFRDQHIGIWGPNYATSNYAVFQVSNDVSQIEYDRGVLEQYMLDHVELVVPEDFPAGPAEGSGQDGAGHYYNYNAAAKLLWGMYNGLDMRDKDPNNFAWSQDQTTWEWSCTLKADESQWASKVAPEARRTCIVENTTPSYASEADEDGCGATFTPEPTPTPSKSYIYFAFEDLGATDDFDFNDVVVRVSAPDENNVAEVELCAAGGLYETYVLNGTTKINNTEIHVLLGSNWGKDGGWESTSNTKNGTCKESSFKNLGTVTVPSGKTVKDLDLSIQVTTDKGTTTRISGPQSTGETPFRIVVAGDANGKWFWPRERQNISQAYTDFGVWGANYEAAGDWSKTYVSSKVVTW